GISTPAESKRGARPRRPRARHDRGGLSEGESPRSHQVGELLALRRLEQAMEPAERRHHRFPQAFGALRAQIRAGPGLRLVEGLAGDRVREGRQRAAMIDRRLRPLGLDLIENLRELSDLRLVETETVREEAQRTAHAEVSAAEAVAEVVFAGHRVLPALEPRTASVRAEPGADVALAAAPGLPVGDESWIHETSSRRGHRSRRVLDARATCLALLPYTTPRPPRI